MIFKADWGTTDAETSDKTATKNKDRQVREEKKKNMRTTVCAKIHELAKGRQIKTAEIIKASSFSQTTSFYWLL